MKNLFDALRPLLTDFLSTIVFIAIYAVTGSVTVGILLGMAVGIGQIGLLLLRRQPVSAMQWASLALVIVLGSASLLTADPRFVMIKPSIGAFSIGLIMLKRGWQARYLPPIVIANVPPGMLVFWGYAWATLLFLLSALNLFVAFAFGLKVWAWYTAVGPLAAQLSMFAVQYATLRYTVVRAIRARQAAGNEHPRAA